MPNPKLGSVTDDINKAVSDAKSGQVEIKNDKDGNIGLSIGKKSFTDDKLVKKFEGELNRKMRSAKMMGSMRKSILLNILNKVFISFFVVNHQLSIGNTYNN